jgi:hypothetical protein
LREIPNEFDKLRTFDVRQRDKGEPVGFSGIKSDYLRGFSGVGRD